MARLSIVQAGGSGSGRFIARNRDTEQSAPEAAVPSPYEWPVAAAGDEKLMAQLRWYLETFLSYPFEPYTDRASRIEEALKGWGIAAFKALFDNRDAGYWLPRQAGAVLSPPDSKWRVHSNRHELLSREQQNRPQTIGPPVSPRDP